MMEKEQLFKHHHHRERLGLGITDDDPTAKYSRSTLLSRATTSSSQDFFLRWGSRKRLRCTKIKSRDDDSSPVHRTTARVDRKVVKDKDQTNTGSIPTTTTSGGGYFNLRQRQASPPQRVLRNSEIMRVQAIGGGATAADHKAVNHHQHQDKKHRDTNNSNHHNHTNNNNVENGGGGLSDHDSKKGGGSSSGSDAVPAVWPPKFVIALTNKEKEEDFMAIKGSKLPQRPKKRAKQIQRTLNLVSPGAWLCDLTLERYEVREKKTSKKRPRGLKAMGNMDSDSE